MLNQALESEITYLAKRPIHDLRALWQSYFSEPAPRFNKVTLANRLAYRMQELEYGSLSPATLKLLRQASDDQILAQKRPNKTIRPVAGTRLVREYNGTEHHVTVLAKGFEYQGQVYKSLSGIARAITGTNWNGNLFFGLKRARRAS